MCCCACSSSVRTERRASQQRHHSQHGWLDSRHTFNFSFHHKPSMENFHALRVLNEDHVSPQEGFPTHGHSSYQIFSYVVDGSIRHKDSLGNIEVIDRGGVQFTNAGTGIRHSEFNASSQDMLHFLQVWVKPVQSLLEPCYSTKYFTEDEKRGKLCHLIKPASQEAIAHAAAVATGAESSDSLSTYQDASEDQISIFADFNAYATILQTGDEVRLPVGKGRAVWIHVVERNPNADVHLSIHPLVDGGDESPVEEHLGMGDGIGVENAEEIVLRGVHAEGEAEVVLFEMDASQ